MLNDSESLDEVFSFLSQIELPGGLTPFEGEASDIQRPMELIPSPVVLSSNVESCCMEELLKSQTFMTSHVETEVEDLTPDEEDDRTTSNTAGSPVSSEDSTLTPKTEQKPKRIRISRKQQIDTLRGEVHELNGQLQTLLLQWHDHNDRIASRRGSMWQEIAARQLKRREKSEQENARLREMLQIQIHEARNLRRVLKRRTKIEMMEDMLGMKRQKMIGNGVPEDNNQVFDNMLQDMDELYVGTDALFLEKGIYDLPCPGRRRSAKRSCTNGQFLELSQRHLVPFDQGTTERAVWKVMGQIIFQGLAQVEDFQPRVQFHAHHVEETNNTIKTSFQVETTNLGDVKGAQFRKVVRKYVEKDRVVLICKNLMEPLLHEKGNTSGFCARTTLRLVIHSENSVTPQSGQLSHIDSHFSATRYDQGLSVSRDIRSPTNLDIGIAAWDEAITRIAYQVESLAIDDSSSQLGTPVNFVT